MGNFIYLAMNDDGKEVKGAIEAFDQKDAVNKIRKLGLTPVRMKESRSSIFANISDTVFNRVTSEDLMVFYVQLHDMMSAGINLLVGLESIEEQVQNKKLKAALGDIIERIRKGAGLSDALEQHKDIFPDLLINMIRSGESSGKLDAVLSSYSILYEEQLDLKQKITTALFYPMVLLCMGAAIIIFLVTFVIPKFVTIFTDAEIALPLPTAILYVMGIAVIRYWYLMVIIAVLAAALIKRYVNTAAGRRKLDILKLKLPLIGVLAHEVALARFSTTLGMLLRSGVPIIKSLELTHAVVQNVVMQEAIAKISSGIEKGEGISTSMKASGRFPANLVQMVAVGEETGNLEGMLERSGEFYNKAVSSMIKKLTVVIEPLFLIILGGAVGFIMASILLPLFKMISAVKA